VGSGDSTWSWDTTTDPNMWTIVYKGQEYGYTNNGTFYIMLETGMVVAQNNQVPSDLKPPGTAPTPLPEWTPSDANHPPDHPLPTGPGSGGQPPAIPGGDGKGNTSVDTPSLDLFIGNMGKLATPVSGLISKMQTMKPVQPGAFYHADQIRAAISGDNGDGGLQHRHRLAATDLNNGLVALQNAMKGLSSKYKTTEELNKGAAQEVQQALSSVSGSFGGVVTDAGGGSAPPSA
jgi:hypothetical protein